MEIRDINDRRTIEEVLDTKGKIAIVGLSPKEHRDSYKVGKYLLDHGYDIVPVRPKTDEVLGRKAYERVSDIDEDVDVVDFFLSPERVEPIVDEAIEKGVKYIWFQFGVINNNAAEKARKHGVHVVMDRCMKVEHQKRM